MSHYKKVITKSEHKTMVKAIMTPEFEKNLADLYRLMYPYVDDYIEWDNAITQIFVLSGSYIPNDEYGYHIVDD